MGGGLMQLVAYGAQDIYLTGNPQITFFKVVYRRHTNFSMEAIKQTFNGTVGTSESSITCTVSRNGDLVSKLWLDVAFPAKTSASDAGLTYCNWTNNLGHALVKECELEIGGQRIDRHYSQWLDIWNELSDHDKSEYLGLGKSSAKNAYLKNTATSNTLPARRTYVPLQFWFCRNVGLALPLIALQYHEVKLKLTTRATAALVNASAGGANPAVTAPTVEVWADYIYLDTDERRRFAQVSHEYLIEQVQREEQAGTASLNMKLNYNHPVKELIWVVQTDAVAAETPTFGTNADATANNSTNAANGNDYFNYQTSSGTSEWIKGVESKESFGTCKLQLNGHDRFTERNASYFRLCQPLQAGHKVPEKHVYCYSFALKPEEHQPSGTCNFSRIDNAKLIFTTCADNSTTVTCWAVNYNVLRIMSGMGGLAYSN